MIKNLLECGLGVLVRSLLPGTINIHLKNASRTVTTSYFVLSTLLCFSLDPVLTLSCHVKHFDPAALLSGSKVKYVLVTASTVCSSKRHTIRWR